MTITPVKRVTAADVARAAGLSRATVGFVLNDTPGQTIPDATRARVIAAAEQLGYRANTAARALASGRSRIILLVLPDWPLDYSMRTHLDEASLALDEAGYSLVTMTPHPGGHARPLWETLRPDVVLGMAPFTPRQLDEMRASGVEHIFPPASDTDAVSAEELRFAEGPRLQVEHLVSRGRRRLAFAESPDRRLSGLVAERRQLAADTLQRAAGTDFVRAEPIDETNASVRLAAWIGAGVDGVVAYNDDIAAQILQAALRQNIGVPGQLAIVGHDDTPLARLVTPTLSTVRIDNAGLGRYLASLALSALNGGPLPSAGPETDARLVIRETS